MSYAKIRPRRSTATEWTLSNPVLMEGEFAVEFPDSGIGTGLCKFKIGDGFKAWTELPYAFNSSAADSIYGGTVTVYHDIWLRSGTTEEWEKANPILGLGEIIYDKTKNAIKKQFTPQNCALTRLCACYVDGEKNKKNAIKVGDGEHTFKEIDYIGYSWEMDDDYDFGDIDLGIQPGEDDFDYDFGNIDYGAA